MSRTISEDEDTLPQGLSVIPRAADAPIRLPPEGRYYPPLWGGQTWP